MGIGGQRRASNQVFDEERNIGLRSLRAIRFAPECRIPAWRLFFGLDMQPQLFRVCTREQTVTCACVQAFFPSLTPPSFCARLTVGRSPRTLKAKRPSSGIPIMTVALKNKSPVVVPPAALRRAGFKRGQELEVESAGGVITIVPKLPTAEDEYTPSQRRAIDRGIAASEKDYKEGRSYGPFRTHEEFIASLHRGRDQATQKEKVNAR